MMSGRRVRPSRPRLAPINLRSPVEPHTKNNAQPRRHIKFNTRTQALVGCIVLLLLIVLGNAPPKAVSVRDVGARAADASPAAWPSGVGATCPKCSDAAEQGKPHLLAATYYSLRGDLRAVLMLNNKGPQPLDV